MKKSVVIIDYGSGNLRSAAKAFEKIIADQDLDFEVLVSDSAVDLQAASHIVLPGQGAFGDCMAGLQASGLIEALEDHVLEQKKPFLGICVGMQLLADKGLEHGEHQGLGWIPGEVVRIEPGDPALKIPHMGWNTLELVQSAESRSIFAGLSESDHVYFVHSYHFKAADQNHVLARTDYGGMLTAAVGRDNIWGLQFHPEKSAASGLRILSNFLSL